jgi:hypothetical protein
MKGIACNCPAAALCSLGFHVNTFRFWMSEGLHFHFDYWTVQMYSKNAFKTIFRNLVKCVWQRGLFFRGMALKRLSGLHSRSSIPYVHMSSFGLLPCCNNFEVCTYKHTSTWELYSYFSTLPRHTIPLMNITNDFWPHLTMVMKPSRASHAFVWVIQYDR